jgi:hypothetical protein
MMARSKGVLKTPHPPHFENVKRSLQTTGPALPLPFISSLEPSVLLSTFSSPMPLTLRNVAYVAFGSAKDGIRGGRVRGLGEYRFGICFCCSNKGQQVRITRYMSVWTPPRTDLVFMVLVDPVRPAIIGTVQRETVLRALSWNFPHLSFNIVFIIPHSWRHIVL